MIGEHTTSIRCIILVDTWKLSIFERHFKEAGIVYTVEIPTTSPEVVTWYVFVQNMKQADYLATVVRAANKEATKTNPN